MSPACRCRAAGLEIHHRKHSKDALPGRIDLEKIRPSRPNYATAPHQESLTTGGRLLKQHALLQPVPAECKVSQ